VSIMSFTKPFAYFLFVLMGDNIVEVASQDSCIWSYKSIHLQNLNNRFGLCEFFESSLHYTKIDLMYQCDGSGCKGHCCHIMHGVVAVAVTFRTGIIVHRKIFILWPIAVVVVMIATVNLS
jgi:hypothetical protein